MKVSKIIIGGLFVTALGFFSVFNTYDQELSLNKKSILANFIHTASAQSEGGGSTVTCPGGMTLCARVLVDRDPYPVYHEYFKD